MASATRSRATPSTSTSITCGASSATPSCRPCAASATASGRRAATETTHEPAPAPDPDPRLGLHPALVAGRGLDALRPARADDALLRPTPGGLGADGCRPAPAVAAAAAGGRPDHAPERGATGNSQRHGLPGQLTARRSPGAEPCHPGAGAGQHRQRLPRPGNQRRAVAQLHRAGRRSAGQHRRPPGRARRAATLGGGGRRGAGDGRPARQPGPALARRRPGSGAAQADSRRPHPARRRLAGATGSWRPCRAN